MFWVVQDNLFQQNERAVVLETLRRFDIPHQLVNVTNKSEVIPDIDHDGAIITNGSVMLSKIANQRGWKPGSLFNENFSYDVWHPHYRNYLLNRDAIFTTIANADPNLETFFVRPVADNKSFTGQVMTKDAFKSWQSDIIEHHGTMPILYASVKAIGQEHRHFIVDGKVVSSSRYKLGSEANQNRTIDPYVIEFASHMASIWQPARAFVLDTYIAGDEIGVIEIGCICHAGFYDADVQKIIMALDGL